MTDLERNLTEYKRKLLDEPHDELVDHLLNCADAILEDLEHNE